MEQVVMLLPVVMEVDIGHLEVIQAVMILVPKEQVLILIMVQTEQEK
jgi:hypothetical protein